MWKPQYELDIDERIIIKESGVQHGFWGSTTDNLIVTNYSVIWEQYGMFDVFKGIRRFDYCNMKQAILGKSENGENQLDLYMDDGKESFKLSTSDKIKLEIFIMAINDQLSEDAERFDYDYYQNLMEDCRKVDEEYENAKMSQGKKNSRTSYGPKNEFLDGIGFYEFTDTLVSAGNEIREGLGFSHVLTRAEKEEIRLKNLRRMDKEKYNKQQELIRKRYEQQTESSEIKENEEKQEESPDSKISIDDQLELLKKLKDLYDAGVLTEEEFKQKKAEILNL